VVTNEHVVRGMADYDHFEMQLAGAPERIPLKLLGVDKETDLAVLKVATDAQLPLPAAHVVWGDSDQLEPGEVVVAVGYPGQGYEIGRDTYFWNATVGILSGLPRRENLTEFIQTTANTDKGYSGGCVFNLRGECVGITAEVEGRGLNFAVASNLARRIVAEIVEHGRVSRGAIGTIWDEVKWVRPVDAVEVGLTIDAWQQFTDKALVVLSVVPGEAADRAGIQRGDLILSIDGSPATWSSGMQRYVASKKPGDVLRVEVFRASGNRQFEVAVTLGDRDQAVGSIGTE
jgi:serine protease Do